MNREVLLANKEKNRYDKRNVGEGLDPPGDFEFQNHIATGDNVNYLDFHHGK